MKRLVIVTSVLVLALLATPVLAQAPNQIKIQPILIGQPGDSTLKLLENKDVQADLKLNMQQVEVINNLIKNQETALKDLKGKARLDKIKELTASNKKAIEELLNPQQTTRLEQLKVQQMGPAAFINPVASKDLNITADQKAKIQEIQKASLTKRTDIIKQTQNDLKERQKKLGELNKEIVQDIVKTLTPDQQQKWKEIAGEPFQGVLPAVGPLGGIGIIRPMPINPQPLPIQPKQVPPNKIKIQKIKVQKAG
jgi:hypothetical protein